MIKGLLEFFREKKPEIIRTEEVTVKVSDSYVRECNTCWYPSEYEIQEVQIVDWEKFEEALEEFSRTFQEGGENSHRNPLNKELK